MTSTAEHKKTMTYGIGNPDPYLELAQTWGGVKSVNGIHPHATPLDNWISKTIHVQIETNNKKNLRRILSILYVFDHVQYVFSLDTNM